MPEKNQLIFRCDSSIRSASSVYSYNYPFTKLQRWTSLSPTKFIQFEL